MTQRGITDGNRFAVLCEIGRLLNSSLEPDVVLNNAMDSVVSLMKAERGFIVLKDKDSGQVHVEVARNMDRQEAEDPNDISRTVVEMVFREGTAIVTNNAQEDPRLADKPSVIRHALRSIISAPLQLKDQIIGVIYLDNRLRQGVFEEEDVEVLAAFSDLAAAAIENARLYQGVRSACEENLRLQERLHREEIERVEAQTASTLKSEWVQWVSHELRTPLTSIRGLAHTLLTVARQQLEPDKRVEFCELIAAEADRMTRLINDLLDLTRIEQGRPLEMHLGSVDLGEIVARLCRVHDVYAHNHSVTACVPPDLPPITADSDKVEQIIANLLNNAIKYSPEGGAIKVEAKEEGDAVVLSVADQGVGIDSAQMPRLFQPYGRLKSEHTGTVRGTGLGLYLTKHLVEAHGGRIWVESEPGKGSTFLVSLPRSPKPNNKLS